MTCKAKRAVGCCKTVFTVTCELTQEQSVESRKAIRFDRVSHRYQERILMDIPHNRHNSCIFLSKIIFLHTENPYAGFFYIKQERKLLL